jgi:hypothetical protein
MAGSGDQKPTHFRLKSHLGADAPVDRRHRVYCEPSMASTWVPTQSHVAKLAFLHLQLIREKVPNG